AIQTRFISPTTTNGGLLNREKKAFRRDTLRLGAPWSKHVRRSPYPQTVGALSNALGLSAEERATMAEAARPSLQHTSAALADTAPSPPTETAPLVRLTALIG